MPVSMGSSDESRNLLSETYLEDEQQSDSSDCGSQVIGPDSEQNSHLPNNVLIRLGDGEENYNVIKNKLVSGLRLWGFNTQVETIHRHTYSNLTGRARLHSFSIYARAMEMKCGGNANVRYAWYGAPKDEIDVILSYGFDLPKRTGLYGQGIHLSAADHPAESLLSSVADENGVRHLLLCRVILGKMEVVSRGSTQFNPSSDQFDSGVDNLVSPTKFIVWATRMNTHIMPDFVVGIKASSAYFGGSQRIPQPVEQPKSERMPFPILYKALSKILPPDAMELIHKHQNDYESQKFTRQEMVQRLRNVVGDRLLITLVKAYLARTRGSRSSGPSNARQ